jgi:phytoene dehydrogenase-like protein
MQVFDCVVIGGGHNGLVTAAYLAKAGKSVCVLERRAVLGGCSTTEPLWPGYRVSTAAYVISLFLPEIIEQLRLKDYGLTILPRNPSSYTPLPDGRSLLMGPDREATLREIAKFSERDAEAFPRYEAMLERVASVLEPILSRTAPDPLPLPGRRRRSEVAKRLRDASGLWDLYRMLARLADDLPEAIELMTAAARPLLERWFESEVLRATLATDAIIGAFAPPSAPGTAYVLLHHVMGSAGGARGIWGYVQGGMGGLADALEAACRDLNVTIRREAPVQRILADSGRVQGVQLADGTWSKRRRWRPASTLTRPSGACAIRRSCPTISWPRSTGSITFRFGQDQPGPVRTAELPGRSVQRRGCPSPRHDAFGSGPGHHRTRL